MVYEPIIFGGPFNEHYGHFLCESIARLWYSLKDHRYAILCRGLSERRVWGKTFLDAFIEGMPIDRRRFISFDNAVILRTAIVPHPSFTIRCEGFEVHKVCTENVAEQLLDGRERRTAQPLYLSRSRLNRKLRKVTNEVVLERALIDRNIAICHPETKSLKEQVNLVNKHDVVIGTLGSALHAVLFDVSREKNLICLGFKDLFVNSNYLLIDAIKSVNSVYVGALDKDPSCCVEERWKQAGIVDVNLVLAVLHDQALI